MRPTRSATATTRSASEGSIASGFSTMTCRPASSAWIAPSTCNDAGVAMMTASTAGSESSSSSELTAAAPGKVVAAA
jgi:hypothetical protein